MNTVSLKIQRYRKNVSGFAAAAAGWFVEPAAGIKPEERRRIRLLSAFLILMTINTLTGSASLKNIGGNSWIVMLATSAVLFFGYFLSRTRYYRMAVILAVTIPAVPPLVIVAFTSQINLTAEFMWLALPLLVSSLMMSMRKSIIVAASYIAFIILLAFFGSLGFDIVAPLMAFILIIAFFVIAITAVREKGQAEIENRLKERHQAEAALRESEEKFSRAFHASPDMIALTTTKDGKYIDVNDSYTLGTGYSREELIGKTTTAIHIWANDADRAKMSGMLRERGRVYNEEFDVRMKSGEIRTWLFSLEPITIGGEPCLIGVSVDITERKRMENALRESEEKYSTLVESGNDGVIIIQDGLLKFANLKMTEMTGFLLKEVINKPFVNFISPEYRDMVVQNYKQRMLGETVPNHYEAEIIGKGDSRIPVEISASMIEYEAKPANMAIVIEITERKRIETALRESEEKFSAAFHSSPQMITISNRKTGKFIEVNDSYVNTTGYSREEFIGHSGAEKDMWVNPEELKRMNWLMQEQGKIRNEEFDFRMKSGEIRKWLCSADTINIGGEPCSIAVAADITERKKRENLQKAENYVLTLLGQGAELNELLDAIARLGEQNDPSVKGSFMLYDSKKNWLSGSGPSLAREYNAVLKIGIPPGPNSGSFGTAAYRKQRLIVTDIKNDPFFKPHKEVVELATRNGLFACWSQPIISSGGDLLGTIANYSNHVGEPTADNLMVLEWSVRIAAIAIERKQAEDKLKHAMIDLEQSSAQLNATNKELVSFSYSVSHDLRSPLRSIDGFSQALLEDYSPRLDETGRDYLNRMRSASQKMGELIDGLLKLSRLTRSEMYLEKVDLSALAEEISARLRETHTNRQTKFVIDSGLSVDGDPQMLRVLLENLLGNAWKFTRKTPRSVIEFGSTAEGDKKTFFIRDNGAGFDMAYKDKLFGAFQRLHDSTEFPGTGIGLATVQRIINRHGGSIRAEGAVGKGAAFYFTLS